MGKIAVSQNITLDGIVSDPTGELGTPGGGWFNRIPDSDREAWAATGYTEAMDGEAFLMGRVTYDYLSARWPSRTGAWADRLNSMPKYVVSSTLTDPQWTNSTILAGDVVDEVTKLKANLTGEIVVAASLQLVRSLIENHLVDELRLVVYPFVVGTGERLFGDAIEPNTLRLTNVGTIGTGLASLTYEVR